MCRWLAYLGAPRYLETLVTEPANSLVRQSLNAQRGTVPTNGDGFGLGWYGDREVPGVYRETLPAWNDRNLRSLCQQISSPLFFAHVRASTGTATTRANYHPFVVGNWLFMHNGKIGNYERVRRRLELDIQDAHYGFREGTTDSELFFLLLFADGLAEGTGTGGAGICEALGRTTRRVLDAMAAAGATEPLRLTAALTDGRRIAAIRYASDDQPPSLYWARSGDHTIIVSEPLEADGAEAWDEVPNGRLLLAEGDAVELRPFHA